MQAKNELSKIGDLSINELQAQVNELKRQIEEITRVTEAFESRLRTALTEELILEMELNALYKEQRKAKKEKRLEQKKRGKNYQEPTGLISQKRAKQAITNPDDEKALKKLYHEAMLLIHPDKFSMQEDKQDIAHEATAQLIQLYHKGDLAALQAYVNHILTGDLTGGVVTDLVSSAIDPLEYLKSELARLQSELAAARNKYTYKVLTTYANPDSFIDELRAYYLDRIAKLKRRTRTK